MVMVAVDPIRVDLGLFWMTLVVVVGVPTTLVLPFRRWYVWIRPFMAQAFIWATTVKPDIVYEEGFDQTGGGSSSRIM